MPPHDPTTSEVANDEAARLRRRLDRERRARAEAEAIAERGLRALYGKQQEIQLLEAIAVSANQATAVRDALQFAVNRVCEYTGWPVGHVYFAAPGGDDVPMSPSAIWHLAAPAQFEPFRLLTERTPLNPGEGLPGRVLTSGQPAWIPDVVSDRNFPRAKAAAAAGLHAAFAFPVLAGTDIVAVLEFFCETAEPPDESLLRVMGHIGTQLGRVVERTRAQERLQYDAFHDHLTGLPNRALFMDRLERAVARTKRHPHHRFAVLFVDLDRFKVVNDSLGHQAGDRLLIDIGQRLYRSLRRDDTVSRPIPAGYKTYDDTLARLGGDEFTILLDDIRDPSDAIRVAERIQHALATPVRLDCDHELTTTASIGITLGSDGHLTAQDLLRDADLAMYRAKTLGRARYALFDPTMHETAVERLRLETALRRALVREEFRIHYQPIVVLDGQRTIGYEALLRWQHPERGLLGPDAFLQTAEDAGLMIAIDHWVLRQACADAIGWQAGADGEAPTVSVNVSAQRFNQSDLVEQVEAVIAETGIEPRRLRLEITETVAMSDAQHATSVLEGLKRLGVHLGLDDFGTGYSSLSYLRRFPVDLLKIDRSFVAQMGHDHDSREIIRAIMMLARSLGVDVIAEGIETAEQLRGLQELQCDLGQGFYISKPKPMPAAEATGVSRR